MKSNFALKLALGLLLLFFWAEVSRTQAEGLNKNLRRPRRQAEDEETTTEAAADTEGEAETEATTAGAEGEPETEATTTAAEGEAETEPSSTAKAEEASTTKIPSSSSKAPSSSPTSEAPSSSSASEVPSDEDFEKEVTPDPFSIVKWTQFKLRAKQIKEALLNLTANFPVISSLGKSDELPAGPSDKNSTIQLLSEFLKSASEFFQPLNEQLEDSIPYTKINPAVGLYTKSLLNTLAVTKPTSNRDRTRIKWVEVNALAVTTHYVFQRLLRILLADGSIEDVGEAFKIQYPSWIEEKNTVDIDSYELMNIEVIVNRIDSQFIFLGDKLQLLRGLEKLLRKKLNDLDPEKTDLNVYCYGNNDYIVVHDVPDLLTDAALYLIMADMKYFVLQTFQLMTKAWGSSKADKAALATEFEDIKKNLSQRIDKKIEIGEPVEIPTPPVTSGPTILPCDKPPSPDTNVTALCLSSPLSPDVHIINNVVTLLSDNSPAKIDDVSKYALYDNGTRIPGIEVYKQFYDANGALIVNSSGYSVNETKVVDKTGAVVEGATVKYLYYPFTDYTDLPRENIIPQYSTSEWGKYQCDLTQNSSTPNRPKDPPYGPLPPTGKPKEGYTDPRLPDYNAAQFGLAYTGYIEAELVLNPEKNCVGTCEDYNSENGSPTCSSKTDERCNLFRKSMCDISQPDCLIRSTCKTKARRCVKTAPSIEFCETSGVTENGRIYEWLKFGDGADTKIIRAIETSTLTTESGGAEGEAGTTVGSNSTAAPTCTNSTVKKVKEHWTMEHNIILMAPEYCELCFCVCDEPLASEGYHVFGLAPITSKVSEGFVITAVKFAQTGNTMQLNVEQGKYIGNGHVDTTSIQWLELPEVDKLADDGTSARLADDGFTKMNLDYIYTGPNEVLTGIRLVVENNALSLQIQATPLDADDKLSGTPSEWRGVGEEGKKRTKLDLSDAESSIKQRGPSQPILNSAKHKYVRFDASSLLKDGGQSVIPFFDLQPSHHHSPIIGRKALQGVGINYKAKPGYGGFLVPSVTLYKKFY